MKVDFGVHCEVDFGDKVSIVGTWPGANFSVACAVDLTWHENNVWKGSVESNRRFAYKYIITRQNGKIEWEDIPPRHCDPTVDLELDEMDAFGVTTIVDPSPGDVTHVHHLESCLSPRKLREEAAEETTVPDIAMPPETGHGVSGADPTLCQELFVKSNPHTDICVPGDLTVGSHEKTTGVDIPFKKYIHKHSTHHKFPLERLQSIALKHEYGVLDPTHLENYLNVNDYRKAFGMSRRSFRKQPEWKQQDLKREARIF